MYPGISKDFKEHNLDCLETGHFQSIFYAYKEVFKAVLSKYPDDEDFIFIEDDVQLLNFQKLHSEMCMARRNGLQFYSFYRTPSQGKSCVYEWGTQTFYIRRKLAEKFAALDKFVYCRLPIDMYIATLGPWFSSNSDIVAHISKSQTKIK